MDTLTVFRDVQIIPFREVLRVPKQDLGKKNMLHQKSIFISILLIIPFICLGQNVGIGTTSPQALLHLNADSNQHPFEIGIAGSKKFEISSDGRTQIYGAPGTSPLILRIGGSPKLTVNQNGGTAIGDAVVPPPDGLLVTGDVGLGVTFPEERLHVSGNILAKNFSGDAEMRVSGANNNSSRLKLFEGSDFGFEFEYDGSPDKLFLHSRGFSGNEGIRMTWLKDGKVGIGSTTPQEKFHVNGNILSTGDYIQVRDGNQAISIVPNAAEGYVKLDVGGTGHSQDHIILGEAGGGSLNKVGIGTSNPGNVISNALLEVNGGHIALGNNFGVLSNNSAGSGIGAGFDTDSDDDLFLFAGGSNRLTVGANGNVGIATSAPEYPLHIKSPGISGQTIAMVIESSVSKRPVILFSEVGSNHTLDNGMSIEYDGTGSSFNNKLRFNKTGGDIAMTIENGGDVGINTSTPASSMHIVQPNSSSGAGLRLEEPADGGYWDIYMNEGANDLDFYFSGALKAYIKDTDGAYIQVSDRRLKMDISPLEKVLSKIDKIQPARYRYQSHPNATMSIGVIAQEVKQVFPEVVSEQNGIKGVNYDAFAVIAIQAIKEQQEIIQHLEEKNRSLEKRIAHIERLISVKAIK